MNGAPGREGFCQRFNVSRETLARLDTLADRVRKWNTAINLVSRGTVEDIWGRHITDSAQLLPLAQAKAGLWTDLGSGGGFPGLVVATLAAEKAPDLRFCCIESDLRKAAFLRTTSTELGIAMAVLTRRIEDAPAQNATIVSARALASLTALIDHANRHLLPGGQALFLKGRTWRDELQSALETWRFTVETCPSVTSSDGVVLSIGDIQRV